MPPVQRNPAAGSLRIIAGSLRGSRIAVADMNGLRPTPDRVRETVFNWLTPIIEGARCLDLYAGTGALGIEALSRGAAACVFVERDRVLARELQENIARLRVDSAHVATDDAAGFLAARPDAQFGVVFIDPPFSQSLWGAAAARLETGGWLQEGALVYVESPVDAQVDLPPNWHPHRSGRAGAVHFALYRRLDPLS